VGVREERKVGCLVEGEQLVAVGAQQQAALVLELSVINLQQKYNALNPKCDPPSSTCNDNAHAQYRSPS
jgi:hypothetical protein